jgi:6-phosphogluconolactonase/glucosamine-6-phosphate isomerase/deaminase
MTVPTINAAARLVFLVTGADKANAVSRAFAGEITAEVPGSLARLAPVPVEVFLDEASAVRLEP